MRQWEFICDVADAIDTEAFEAARAKRDAIGCYQAVYQALGMDSRKIDAKFKAAAQQF